MRLGLAEFNDTLSCGNGRRTGRLPRGRARSWLGTELVVRVVRPGLGSSSAALLLCGRYLVRQAGRNCQPAVKGCLALGNLFGSVLEFARSFLKSTALGPETARGQRLLRRRETLARALAAVLAASSALRRRRLWMLNKVVSHGLAVMLLVVIAVPAKRAHAACALVVR